MVDLVKKIAPKDTLACAETVNTIIKGLRVSLKQKSYQDFLYMNDLESPWSQSWLDLRSSVSEKLVLDLLPYLHKAVKIILLHLPKGTHILSKNHIWLCYHVGDTQSMQHLLYLYLQEPKYDSRTLAYAVNCFVLNYDVEFSKNIFQTIVDSGKPLGSILLSSTVINFIKVGALFENLQAIFKFWIDRPSCSPPHARSMALLLRQYQKYGHSDEILALESVIHDLGISKNFLIRMARLQADIINRDTNQKKLLTEADVTRFYTIKNDIFHSKDDLRIFYESCLAFFARHTSTHVVQLILEEMVQDNVAMSPFAFDTILRHYVSERKFVPLLAFLQGSVVHNLPFQLQHAKYLFDAFIRNYPHESGDFIARFAEWVKLSQLNPDDKHRLLDNCRARRSDSLMTPFTVSQNELGNERKYASSQWRALNIEVGKLLDKKAGSKHQVRFRINKGLSDLISRGIKPDYSILESTLRQLNYAYRINILRLLEPLRMTRSLTRMQIIHMLLGDTTDKREVEAFADLMRYKLNTSDKIFLARRLMNASSYQHAANLLDSVHEVDMTDQRRLLVLNLKLRIELGRGNFDRFDGVIDSFPIDEVTLSTYIFKQCCFVEKSLTRKIKALEAQHHDAEAVTHMKSSLEKLRGLIGDIQVRLELDKRDLAETVTDTLNMLDAWIEKLQSFIEST